MNIDGFPYALSENQSTSGLRCAFQVVVYESDASKVLKSMPADSQSLSLRAHAYDSRSQYKKEMKDVEALLNFDHSARNLLWHARLAERFSFPKQVIDDCNQAINLGLVRDELAQLYKLRAGAYKKLGKKNESEQELAKYESLGPLAPQGH